ncbi:hypothetical protein ACFY8C_13200 [Streptomyces flavochromogenes]|uniref:Uncharacterized protein n=1 Tax=Streptomyces flavochromogenes TaxID=68199 RepID=A0ABW6XP87_9ACTN
MRTLPTAREAPAVAAPPRNAVGLGLGDADAAAAVKAAAARKK